MAYVPNPADATQPTEDKLAQTAAAEFRALKAYVQSIVSGGGLGVATPGQIVMFTGNTPLPGWLELDGSIQLRSSYPQLWNAVQALGGVVTEAVWASNAASFSSGDLTTTFRLPDWRGVFVRGFNHGRAGAAFDAGRAISSFQPATKIADYGGTPGGLNVPQNGYNTNNAEDGLVLASAYNSAAGGAGAGNANYVSVRPINVPAMYCVKT